MANPNPTEARQAKQAKRKARRKVGSLQDAQALLWRALERAGQLLELPEPEMALRAIHAVSQGASAYARIIEVGKLEDRLTELEDKLSTLQACSPTPQRGMR